MSFPANSSNLPVEVLEQALPVRVRRCGLRPDSGGPGKYRGGCGQIYEIESISKRPLTIRAEHGKLAIAPLGLRGGRAGAPGGLFLNGTPVADKMAVTLNRGDVLRLEVPGSGGMYDPRDRDRDALARDVADGIVTREHAVREYGAVAERAHAAD